MNKNLVRLLLLGAASVATSGAVLYPKYAVLLAALAAGLTGLAAPTPGKAAP